MQHLIDVEQAWLLGKVPTPKRIGGGFARLNRGAGESLGNETEYFHNRARPCRATARRATLYHPAERLRRPTRACVTRPLLTRNGAHGAVPSS